MGGSGSTKAPEYGSNTEPDPQHCLCVGPNDVNRFENSETSSHNQFLQGKQMALLVFFPEHFWQPALSPPASVSSCIVESTGV